MPPRSRTTWVAWLLALAGAWVVLVNVVAWDDPEARGGARVHPAAAFLDSVGVQTHGDYFDTAYADAPRVERAIRALGIRHVRDGVTPNLGNERHLRFLERLGRAGIRLNLTVDMPRGPGAPVHDRLTAIRERLLPYTVSLEGPNEKDMAGLPDWPERVRAYQRELHGKAKADPALRHLPVLAPSLGRNANQPALGDLGGIADWGNLHSYPGALPPSRAQLGGEIAAARAAVGGAPLVVTETGYHNALQQSGGQPPISERGAAVYYPRLFLEHFMAGVRRTYAYELLDEKPEPALTDKEQHFGLLRNDFSPKPAAGSIRRLLALARGPGADEDGDGGPRSLALEVSAPAPLRRLVLHRADGRLVVLLWQTARVWDLARWRDLRRPSVRAELELGATFGRVERHLVGPEPAPSRDLGARRGLAVDVPADAVVGLVLGPGPGAPPAPFVLPPRRRPPRAALPEPAPGRREEDAEHAGETPEDDPRRL